MTMTRFLSLPALLLAAACASMAPNSSVVGETTLNWRAVASQYDRERLRGWRTSFAEALAMARRSGHSAEIAREGALLNPDAAIGGGPIPNGMYRCRVIKVGAKAEGVLDYVAYSGFACRVRPEHGVQGLAKLSGSQRYIGLIYPGDELRQVFLGTLALGDEQRAAQYGVDKDRDIVGYVERIGPKRWRLIMPEPAFESRIDVLELVPAEG
jgi:hypothetical protein